MLDVKVFERIEMISVVLQLGRAHVEMALIPYREINSSIIGRSAVAAQTQYNSLAQLRKLRLCKLQVFVSVLVVFTTILAAGVGHYNIQDFFCISKQFELQVT